MYKFKQYKTITIMCDKLQECLTENVIKGWEPVALTSVRDSEGRKLIIIMGSNGHD